DATKIINLTLRFDEQKQYYVRRIDFSGNTTTRDKVIRRDLMIDEGQLFNKRLWELSILRLNQLDYFDKIEADKAAEIKRSKKALLISTSSSRKRASSPSVCKGASAALPAASSALRIRPTTSWALARLLLFPPHSAIFRAVSSSGLPSLIFLTGPSPQVSRFFPAATSLTRPAMPRS